MTLHQIGSEVTNAILGLSEIAIIAIAAFTFLAVILVIVGFVARALRGFNETAAESGIALVHVNANSPRPWTLATASSRAWKESATAAAARARRDMLHIS